MEAQQCVKLTVTNSSIDFFVPIDYVHRTKFDDIIFCPDARRAPDGPRHKVFCLTAKTGRRDGVASCMAATLDLGQRWNTDGSQKDV